MKNRSILFTLILCFTMLTSVEASEWFPVPQFMSEAEIAKVYQKAVRSQIIEQKGVRNSSGSSGLELNWLKQVAQSEREWQMNLQELERGYRRALSEVINQQTEHQSRLVLGSQYDNRIATLEAEIRELQVRSRQIVEERQRYEQGLDNLPLTTMAVVKVLYTEELATRLKESGYEHPIFRKAGEAALKTVLETYSTQTEIPLEEGGEQQAPTSDTARANILLEALTMRDQIEEEQNEILRNLNIISARVVRVLPDGNMVIRGRKVDYRQRNKVRYITTVTGILRPADVSDTNIVSAAKLAYPDVKIKRQQSGSLLRERLERLAPLTGRQQAGLAGRLSEFAGPGQ